jgi:hypothetical protein
MASYSSENPKFRVGEVVQVRVPFLTTAAAEDKNILIMECMSHPFIITFAVINFTALDTFADGVDIDVEVDDGTTETTLAYYDTVGGGSATAVDTIYSMSAGTVAPRCPVGSWLQLHVDDDENAACEGVVYLEGYYEAG